MIAVFGTGVSEGVEALLCSVEGTQLDLVLGEDGDVSLHLRDFGNLSSNLLRRKCVQCGRGNAKLGPKELGGIIIDGVMWDARLKIEKGVTTRPLMMLLVVTNEPETFLKGLDSVLSFLEGLQGVGDFFFKLRRLSSLLVNGLIEMNEGTGFSSFGFLIERDLKVQVFHPTNEIISGERCGVNHGKRRWGCNNFRLEQAGR